jgi:hypothetical protein
MNNEFVKAMVNEANGYKLKDGAVTACIMPWNAKERFGSLLNWWIPIAVNRDELWETWGPVPRPSFNDLWQSYLKEQ